MVTKAFRLGVLFGLTPEQTQKIKSVNASQKPFGLESYSDRKSLVLKERLGVRMSQKPFGLESYSDPKWEGVKDEVKIVTKAFRLGVLFGHKIKAVNAPATAGGHKSLSAWSPIRTYSGIP